MAGQNNFLPGPSGSFYSYLTSNEECERGFYPNLYEPYPGCSSGYWQHEQVAFGRESSVGARMEQSPSTANKEASKSRATSNPKEKKKYETWSQGEQKLLVQLWADNHELLESRESRTAWRKICDELNSRMETNKTVEKCMKKMKYLIDKFKEAKEWNRKQTGGTRRQSVFYEEIDAILGCRDIVTLRNVSEAGASTSANSNDSPLNTSNSSSGVGSPEGSDDLDAEPNRNKQSKGQLKTKDARNDRKKQSKQSRKRNRAAFEESEEEDRKELRESMDAFKKCGENLSNFMATFSETQKQQMAMMGQFIGAMTQFMSTNANPGSSSTG